jgi:hypothetical protein
MQSPIFTSYYTDRSRSGSTDVCVNLYPEHEDGKDAPEISLLLDTPCISAPVVTVGTGPIRCEYVSASGVLYVVSGNGLYSLSSSYVSNFLGSIATSYGPVEIVENPTQLLIIDGINGWVWGLLTNQLSQTLPNGDTSDFSPNSVSYQDGFAIVNSKKSNQIYQSNYNDFTKFATPNGGNLGSTANNAFVQGNANYVVAVADIRREMWVFKSNVVEVWINQGAAGFAFDQLQGVYIHAGCCAPNSIARLGESLVWLGSDEQGDGIVYLGQGYNATPITTFALAQTFQGFPIVSDAQAFSYQWYGHYFYVLTFPSQGATYVFDLVSRKWHQWGIFSNGDIGRANANAHAFFNRRHLVGDYSNGNIYALSDLLNTDNGAIRKWARSWRALPPGMPLGIPMSFDSLQIDMETGITTPDGYYPNVMLRWSDDGGYNWVGPFLMPAGKIGQTAWRVIQFRLGSTRIETGLDRVFEISCTDNINIKIFGATVEGGPA